MSEPTSLTAVVLCHNSEKTLATCLHSVAFATEIIVADDGSTDNSLEIAKQHKVTIIKLSKTSDFSAKRNEALSAVQTEWTLFIDSDEEVSTVLKESITTFISTAHSTTTAATIKREDVFLGKHLRFGETGSTWLVRLARTHAGTWERRVHEIWNVAGDCRPLSGILTHRPHQSIQSLFEKVTRYSALEAQHRVEHPSSGLRSKTMVELFLFPPLKFFYTFILKAGFRDGFPGLVMSYMMSMHSLWVRIQILELLRQR